jgi:hypothetical protein
LLRHLSFWPALSHISFRFVIFAFRKEKKFPTHRSDRETVADIRNGHNTPAKSPDRQQQRDNDRPAN